MDDPSILPQLVLKIIFLFFNLAMVAPNKFL